MRRIRPRHVLHAVALVVGAVVLGFSIEHLGREGFESAMLRTGLVGFAALAAIDFASLLCDAAGVYSFVRPNAEISFARVFVAQASGLAINRLTPGNSLGEPIKVTMLMAHVPRSAAVSAIVLFNVANYVVAVGAIAIGVSLTLLMLDLPMRAEVVVLAVTVILAALMVGLIRLTHRGALATLVRVGRRLRLLSTARAERWRDKLSDIDAHLQQFGDRATRRALIFVALSRLLNMAGGVVILAAAGHELTGALVLGTMSVGILISWISSVIPLGLGLADGSTYALYGALGASPGAGLEFAMINRVRTVVLASIGLVVMALSHVFDRATHDR